MKRLRPNVQRHVVTDGVLSYCVSQDERRRRNPVTGVAGSVKMDAQRYAKLCRAQFVLRVKRHG